MLPQPDLLQWLLPVPQPEPLPEMVGMLPQPDLLQWLLPVPLGGLQLLPLPELVGMLRILFLLPLPELVGMLPQPDLLQWLLPVPQPEPLPELGGHGVPARASGHAVAAAARAPTVNPLPGAPAGAGGHAIDHGRQDGERRAQRRSIPLTFEEELEEYKRIRHHKYG
ncbi:inverted formin-2-like [Thrips palmi]|uniref:Inverted formin-2-like n=1 Tax=Thrips palmi TaxID=161013 RepID=A0A6P8ZXL8_THRPL|nr:inverted formin-2-like [Thrips palmi]